MTNEEREDVQAHKIVLHFPGYPAVPVYAYGREVGDVKQPKRKHHVMDARLRDRVFTH